MSLVLVPAICDGVKLEDVIVGPSDLDMRDVRT
jgi:hypothetical protein